MSTVSPLLNASPYVPLRRSCGTPRGPEETPRKRLRAPPPSAHVVLRGAGRTRPGTPRAGSPPRRARRHASPLRAALSASSVGTSNETSPSAAAIVPTPFAASGDRRRDVVLRFGVRRRRGRRRRSLFLRVLPPRDSSSSSLSTNSSSTSTERSRSASSSTASPGENDSGIARSHSRGEREFGAGGGGRRRPGRRRRRGEELLGGRRDARVFAEAHGSLRTRRVRVVARRRHSARRLLRDGRARALRLGREREPVHLGEELFLLFQLGAHRRGVVPCGRRRARQPRAAVLVLPHPLRLLQHRAGPAAVAVAVVEGALVVAVLRFIGRGRFRRLRGLARARRRGHRERIQRGREAVRVALRRAIRRGCLVAPARVRDDLGVRGFARGRARHRTGGEGSTAFASTAASASRDAMAPVVERPERVEGRDARGEVARASCAGAGCVRDGGDDEVGARALWHRAGYSPHDTKRTELPRGNFVPLGGFIGRLDRKTAIVVDRGFPKAERPFGRFTESRFFENWAGKNPEVYSLGFAATVYFWTVIGGSGACGGGGEILFMTVRKRLYSIPNDLGARDRDARVVTSNGARLTTTRPST